MARKLKTYLTSLGFFDQAVAAPSMKAALEAWGADSNLFHQGFAAEIDDPDIVEATMAHPGVVLKRPVGSKQSFKLSADLPKQLASDGTKPRSSKAAGTRKRTAGGDAKADAGKDAKAERTAALAFEKEQRRRAEQQKKEEAARVRRERLVAKAQAALEEAEQDHRKRASAIESERASVEKKADAEEARWEEQKRKLEQAVRRARS